LSKAREHIGGTVNYGGTSIAKTPRYMEVQVALKTLVKLKTKTYFKHTKIYFVVSYTHLVITAQKITQNIWIK